MNQQPTDDGPGQGSQRLVPPSPAPPRGQSGLFKGVAVIAVIVTMFMIPIVSFSEIKKKDAFDPATEAIYLRYLLGDDAPQSNAVSPRLQATLEQRQRETAAVYARLNELMPNKSESEMDEIALIILAIPQTQGIDPEASHLWRKHLVDVYYYKAVGAY